MLETRCLEYAYMLRYVCLEADIFFWSCERLESFWGDVHLVLTKVFGREIPVSGVSASDNRKGSNLCTEQLEKL